MAGLHERCPMRSTLPVISKTRCPNRANVSIAVPGFQNRFQTLHLDAYCNECGNCACNCVEPCQPYKDRLTFFLDKARLDASTNDGFYKAGDLWGYRFEGTTAEVPLAQLPAALQPVVAQFEKELPYYVG